LIVTVTLNAAVDKTYTVENFALDRVHRPSSQKSTAGGKGINVARVLLALGQPAIASGFIGGHNGKLITAGLQEEGIPYDFVKTHGESRICIAIVDPIRTGQTEVNEIGPQVQPDEIEAMQEKIKSLLSNASHLVLSGSAPPGTPDDFYVHAIESAKAAGVKSVLDTSGEYLRQGVKALPYMVKPNVAELSAYVGAELYTVEEILEAARQLAKSGINIVVVSMGRAGAIVTDGENAWQAVPPEIKFISAVGSGDSLVAAFLDATIRGAELPEALKVGTAAGAANAEVCGAGLCTAESINALLPYIKVTRLL